MIVTALLFSIGIVMVFNTTSAEVLGDRESAFAHALVMKQMGIFLIGIIIAAGIYAKGIDWCMQKAPLAFALGVGALLLVFVPKVGMQINGAHRWINLLGISLQPSEFLKGIIPLYFAKSHVQVKSFKEFCLRQIPFYAAILLILVEPDNGTGFILLCTMLVLYFLSRVEWKYWVIASVAFISAVALLALSHPHVKSRIDVYLHPEKDLLGKGHQPYQAKIATGSGGLFGRGLGESVQKLSYLPEARSDYIAAIYAEEFGFAGIAVMIVLYMGMALSGFVISKGAAIEKHKIVALTFTFVIAFQAFLNLAIVSGLLPSKGTNLPFFSQGGSSLWANMMMAACIFSIHKGRPEWKRQFS